MRFFLKFGEVLLLWLIAIGMLQLSTHLTEIEYALVTRPWVLWGTLGGIVVISAGIAYWWNRKGGGERLHPIFQTAAVVYLALWIAHYGAAKILGTQFQTPYSVLDTPMGELNGFWLTWGYYGFSHSMALILGWMQITGCVLILFRVTRLLGIFLLLPVLVNIDLIDHFYDISPLAYYNALHYTFFLVVLLLIDMPILKGIFLAYRNSSGSWLKQVSLFVLRLAVIVLAFMQVAALKNSLTPRTRINGVWRVDPARSGVGGDSGLAGRENRVWSKLYFEWRYGCTFKVEPGQFTDKDLHGDYTVDEKKDSVRIGFDNADATAGLPAADSMILHYIFRTDSLLEMRGRYKKDPMVLYAKRLK